MKVRLSKVGTFMGIDIYAYPTLDYESENTAEKKKIKINDELSLLRPAWTQDNLFAFRDLHKTISGKFAKPIVKNYFVRTHGINK